MSERPTRREDSPLYRCYLGQSKRKDPPSRQSPGNLSWHLAKLEVGQVLLIPVGDRAAYKSVYNRTCAARSNKDLQGRRFYCQLLHCEPMHDPSTTYLIARIERLQDTLPKETAE